MITQLSKYFEMHVSQYLPDKYWKKRRDVRLIRLLNHAYATVPYYRQLFDTAGIAPGDIRCSDDLRHLPVTRKQDLQALPLESRISTKYQMSALRHMRTTGSTGYPFDIYHDANFQKTRTLLFLRSLRGGTYRYPMRLLGTANERKTDSAMYRLLRWQYLPNTVDVKTFVRQVESIKPDVLYTTVSAIRPLVEHLYDSGRKFDGISAVYTTAEELDARTRRLLGEFVSQQVFEIYGMTECGALAWECSTHNGLHLAEDRVIFEFTGSGVPESRNLVVTSIDSFGMPLIRYEVGDMVSPPIAEKCACGGQFNRIKKVEGRLFDTITLKDGTGLSPIHLTSAMEALTWVRRYQIVQEAIGKVRVNVQTFDGAVGVDIHAVKEVLTPVLGPEHSIEVDIVDSIHVAPGVKFRTVQNKLLSAP